MPDDDPPVDECFVCFEALIGRDRTEYHVDRDGWPVHPECCPLCHGPAPVERGTRRNLGGVA